MDLAKHTGNIAILIIGHTLALVSAFYDLRRDSLAVVGAIIWFVIFVPITTLVAIYAPLPVSLVVSVLYVLLASYVFYKSYKQREITN